MSLKWIVETEKRDSFARANVFICIRMRVDKGATLALSRCVERVIENARSDGNSSTVNRVFAKVSAQLPWCPL